MQRRALRASARSPQLEAPALQQPIERAGIASELEALVALHQKGALTDSEFAAAKAKLAAAKELQEEFLEREKRKTAERMAKKEATAAAAATQSTESSS